MLKITPQSTEEILVIKASGTLRHEDYEAFIPLLDATVQSGNHIYLMADITEFESITPHAMLDDFLTGMKYWWNFEAVAIIGNKDWEKYAAKIFNYVSPSEVKYFEAGQEPEAWRWLEEEYRTGEK